MVTIEEKDPMPQHGKLNCDMRWPSKVNDSYIKEKNPERLLSL